MPAPLRVEVSIPEHVALVQWLASSVSRLVVFQCLASHGPMSGAEVARVSGLGTSHKILRELEVRNLVQASQTGQRKFQEFTFSANLALFLPALEEFSEWIDGKGIEEETS